MIIYDMIQIKNIISDIIKTSRVVTIGGKKYIRVCCGYDTETTRKENRSYIYHFALSFNKYVFGAVTWTNYITIHDHINKEMHRRFRRRKYPILLLIWVANLSFEFQFLKDRMDWEIFATNSRQPLTITNGGIQYRECLRISGGNLAHLAKTFCTTQKMTGDLDYTKERNSKAYLTFTDKEKKYIENDVVILSEFADYVFKKSPEWGGIPYTSTGILRMECKQEIKRDSGYKKYIRDSYFEYDDYIKYMRWLFRGGYTHANRAYTNIILNDVESYDKKSSYPAQMLQQYYPYGKFNNCVFREEFTEKYCCIIEAKFYNIRNATTHSIESSHKIIDSHGALWDNGRLMRADYIKVILTELDYKIYKLFYKWDNMTVTECKIAMRAPLPEFLRRLVLKYFCLKEMTPKDTVDYFISKQKVNAFYGMCVTHLHFKEWVYSEHEWHEEYAKKKNGNIKTFEDMIKNEFLLPAFGIWITAHARFDLLSMVYAMRENVVYCDTDSIYLTKGYNKEIITRRNKEIEQLNKAGDQKNFPKIGQYAYEGRYKRFKTLGAKKYVKEYYRADMKKKRYKVTNIKHKTMIYQHRSYYLTLHLTTQTIAGLGKNALCEYCNKYRKDIFDVFTPDMLLLDIYSQKLITHYEDHPHSDIVNGELMHELSSISLIPSPFAMHVDKNYLNLIIKERLEHGDRLEKSKSPI